MAGDEAGDVDGLFPQGRLDGPNGVALGPDGNLYVADASNHRIRIVTPQGEVATLAGSIRGYQDQPLRAAQFNSPYGVAVDADRNVYVADTFNHRIRKITRNGEVSTIAGAGVAGFKDGSGLQAQFNLPFSVDVDAAGNLYIADAGNHRIRKISPLGSVTTVAGSGASGRADGTALQARFSIPNDVAVDANGNLYVADFGNHCVRRISFGGQVTTVAGNGVSGLVDGAGTSAQFNSPTGLTLDSVGNIYVADNGNHRIRQIMVNGMVLTLAGGGLGGMVEGAGPTARFDGPTDLAVDALGRIYVSDTGNSRIRVLQ